VDEWDKYQEEMKFKYPKVFENALKIQSLYPETDRGAALIVAAVLEEQLTLILYSFLRDSKSAKILLDGFNAPIGQFSSKIHLCHALGLKVEQYKNKKWFPVSEQKMLQAQGIYQKYGFWSLLLSWVPVIGDPITLIAGLLKENFVRFVVMVSIAKIGRYLFVYWMFSQF
jgi:membrane protein DedA with SNARE-associated domain